MRVLLLLAVGVSGLPPPDGNAYAEATPRALTFATVPHVAAEAPVLPGRMTYSGSTTSGADSWVADWGASPSERCQVWATNSVWGALVYGQTLHRACQSDWAKASCAGTCTPTDTWDAGWGASPSERCQVWSTNSAWGALMNGQTLQQACQSNWAQERCGGTCCPYI